MHDLWSKDDLEKLWNLEKKDGRYVGMDDGRGLLVLCMTELDASRPVDRGGYQSLVCRLCAGLLRLVIRERSEGRLAC